MVKRGLGFRRLEVLDTSEPNARSIEEGISEGVGERGNGKIARRGSHRPWNWIKGNARKTEALIARAMYQGTRRMKIGSKAGGPLSC